jgi:ornithine carbamoyltransferase
MAIDHHTRVRDVLAISELSSLELHELLELSHLMKLQPRGWLDALAGETVACFFQKPSTRTRVSLHGAIARLGGAPLLIRPDELQLGRGEPVSDTARVLSGYACAIAARVFRQTDLETMAAHSTVPVVNALSDLHHPCQALADLLTVHERFGTLAGVQLAYIGEGNNVAHSLLEAGALAGMHVAVAAPGDLAPDPAIVERAATLAGENGGSILITEDPVEAAAGASVVYTDVWVSMGDETDAEAHMEKLRPYQVNEELMGVARADAVFMHCLPAHRGEEVTAEVIDGHRSAVWQQAANRLPTEQALIYALVTGDWTRKEHTG